MAGPLRILVLGGTGFIGPYQVARALERGHRVSIFNRGLRPVRLPATVELLRGDRDGDLDVLRRGRWDVVVDNSATLPEWVRRSASLLSERADRYLFVSTMSAYASQAMPDADESAPLAAYEGPDPMARTEVTPQAYGALKALAEEEVHRWFPERATVVRPGLIVGPGDPTDRFTYWPVRLSRGGDVLAPGTPDDPVQVIDARDLADWIIRLVEAGSTGTFNATGPGRPLRMGELLEQVGRAVGAEARPVWVDGDFLAACGVRPWLDLPAWVPPSGGSAGFMRRSIRRALDAGLSFRPLADTARDTLSWFRSLPAERRAKLAAGLSPEREAEVLAQWRGGRTPAAPGEPAPGAVSAGRDVGGERPAQLETDRLGRGLSQERGGAGPVGGAGQGGSKTELLGLCRSLPGSTEDVKWGDHLVFSVGGKMFAIFDTSASDALRIPVDPAVFPILTREPGITPAPYLAQHGWVKLERLTVLPPDQVSELVREAHLRVAEKLSRKARARLGIG